MATHIRPPPGYVTIQEAMIQRNGFVNVIGSVVEIQPPKQSRGTDYMATYSLWDPSSYSPNGLRFRAFRILERLPNVRTAGDIMLLKQVKIQDQNFGLIAITNYGTRYIVFHQESLSTPGLRDEVSSGRRTLVGVGDDPDQIPTLEEQLYVLDLFASRSSPSEMHLVQHPFSVPQNRYPPPAPIVQRSPAPVISRSPTNNFIPINSAYHSGNQKFRQLKDLDNDIYADLVVQIVKIFHRSSGDQTDVYVTDYTSNSMFFDYLQPDEEEALHGTRRDMEEDFGYGSNQAWPGPFGQHTMCVLMFYPHSEAVRRDFEEGKICFLKNIRTKLSQSGRLEARLSQDNRFPDQVNIRNVNAADDRVQALRLRKEEYEKKQNTAALPKKNSKQRRKEKKARQRAQAAEERKALEVREAQRENGALPRSLIPQDKTSDSVPVKPSANQYVAASHPDQPLVTVASIINNPNLQGVHNGRAITLPFVNAKYRVLVKVVDFWPPTVAEFSHSLSDTTWNTPPDSDGEDSQVNHYTQSLSQHEARKWEWAFALQVEDAMCAKPDSKPATIDILVSHDAAEFLLKMDATDLRRDRKALLALKEKLFTLWGNLEEIKSKEEWKKSVRDRQVTVDMDDTPRSQPFECCVEEYGVRDETAEGGWKRMWRMFGTTLQ